MRGFTLVELMVVIVLLGLLAGIVGTQVIPMLIEGTETTARTQLSVFRDALELYYLDHTRYPEDLADLVLPTKKRPFGYLDAKTVPEDPWGAEYLYDPRGGEARPYLIWSAGPDGQDGTEDDITTEE